jgi:hypothetical protein
MELSIENIIKLVQNEPVLCDRTRNAAEEKKDLAWKRIADILGTYQMVGYKIVRRYFRAYTVNYR